MSPQKPVTVFLLTSLVAVVFGISASEFDCGTNKKEQLVLYLAMGTGCPHGTSGTDKCCEAHDLCYDDQLGQSYCDLTFRDCLQKNVAEKSWFLIIPYPFCKAVPKIYYAAVKAWGAKAYKNAGIESQAKKASLGTTSVTFTAQKLTKRSTASTSKEPRDILASEGSTMVSGTSGLKAGISIENSSTQNSTKASLTVGASEIVKTEDSTVASRTSGTNKKSDQRAENSTDDGAQNTARNVSSEVENEASVFGFGTFEAVLALLWIVRGFH
ncbi:hypothetical protein L596_010803 [Steinernema carpocapsae]|uniref:Phospholipase A2 domain-containing protein n=1 Tax=Steinernema carpocapsae TaxID=34508 RepID=A0A4U5PJZ0_STECR|nr:hypothetical protein L596_010803 [Steinernema carpocapsae]